jgi:hypothetical protein
MTLHAFHISITLFGLHVIILTSNFQATLPHSTVFLVVCSTEVSCYVFQMLDIPWGSNNLYTGGGFV